MGTEEHIEHIARQIMAIAGIIMYVFGSIGNILNIIIFMKWSYSRRALNINPHNRRKSNSSLYLLASSIANLVLIIYPLLIRILLDGYQYDGIENQVFIVCKLEAFILHTSDIISLTCICLTTFDRYLTTSREVHLRQMSLTREKTKLIILFVSFIIACHSIPLFIYFDLSNTGKCASHSGIYLIYYLIAFHILLHGLIPVVFLTVFGILTFKQLKLIGRINPINNLNSDKQLSRMLLLMSIAIILSSIPNCIEQIHDVWLLYNDEPESSYLFLFHMIASLLFYINPVYCFYIFYVSTPNFRKQVHKLILRKKYRHFMTGNQINLSPGNLDMTTRNLQIKKD